VQIVSGLQAGDEVVVSDMKEHLETRELIVKE
jgi:HlyD family secretion protein